MRDQSIFASIALTPDDGLTLEDLGERPTAVLSAAVLRAARAGCQKSQEYFARQAGVSVAMFEAIEQGKHPAWALSSRTFSDVASAVSAISPWMRGIFEAAAACDLLLSCVLDGDQAFATDVLADAATCELAAALLRWAVSGQLLSDADVSLLQDRAAALAASSGPDAWVGAQLLTICRGSCPPAASAPQTPGPEGKSS